MDAHNHKNVLAYVFIVHWKNGFDIGCRNFLRTDRTWLKPMKCLKIFKIEIHWSKVYRKLINFEISHNPKNDRMWPMMPKEIPENDIEVLNLLLVMTIGSITKKGL